MDMCGLRCADEDKRVGEGSRLAMVVIESALKVLDSRQLRERERSAEMREMQAC